jgi:hypothetical protein
MTGIELPRGGVDEQEGDLEGQANPPLQSFAIARAIPIALQLEAWMEWFGHRARVSSWETEGVSAIDQDSGLPPQKVRCGWECIDEVLVEGDAKRVFTIAYILDLTDSRPSDAGLVIGVVAAL